MPSTAVQLREARAAIERLGLHLAAYGVPETVIRALVEDTDPGRCGDASGFAVCELDLGHPGVRHLTVAPPAPGEKTQSEWATRWSEHGRKPWLSKDTPFALPGADSPAMRAHTELVDEERVFICQPVTDRLLYVHIRLGRADAGLTSWLRRIGLKPGQATRTEHGDYLARGLFHGARVDLTAHAHSYR